MGFEKRGLSGTWISIIIVLAVFVLAIVVFNLVGKEETVAPDPIASQCASACESQQKVAFCDVQRSFEGGLATCNELATNSQYSQYNVQTCPSISCTIPGTGGTQTNDQTCAGLGGTWVAPTESGTCPSQEGKLARKRTPTDSPTTTGQIFCYYYE